MLSADYYEAKAKGDTQCPGLHLEQHFFLVCSAEEQFSWSFAYDHVQMCTTGSRRELSGESCVWE